MSSIRIAHLADLHLNASPDMGEALRCLKFALETAVERNCQYILIAGDVWHKMPTVHEIALAQQVFQLSRWKDRIIMIYGNHDPEESLDVLCLPNLNVHRSAGQVILPGLVLSTLPYPTKANIMRWMPASQDASDLAAADMLRTIIRGFAAGFAQVSGLEFGVPCDTPHIMMYHGNVSGAEMTNGQVLIGGDIMLTARDLEESGADYIALGHIHKTQQMSEKAHYSGSLWNTNYGETDQTCMLVVDVEHGKPPQCTVVDLPSTRKCTVDLRIGPDGKPDADLRDIAWCYAGDDVKIRYRISQEQAATFDESALPVPDFARSIIYERIIIPSERTRSEHITTAETLRSKVDAWGHSIEREVPAGVLDKADSIQTKVDGGAR